MNFVLMPQSAVVASIVVVAAVCQTSSLSNVISILILLYSTLKLPFDQLWQTYIKDWEDVLYDFVVLCQSQLSLTS